MLYDDAIARWLVWWQAGPPNSPPLTDAYGKQKESLTAGEGN
jgi:hypothetical protein